ncbi:hypothetical protein GQ53DRAFT_869337 [Thozetella sp. PMI_491]|nr:hypothetical protein GQ53DRAFT_869337 [Thozetella sp. PMI_491]
MPLGPQDAEAATEDSGTSEIAQVEPLADESAPSYADGSPSASTQHEDAAIRVAQESNTHHQENHLGSDKLESLTSENNTANPKMPPILQHMSKVDDTARAYQQAMSCGLPGRRLYIPLASHVEVVELVEFYVQDINATLPIFGSDSLRLMTKDRFPVDENSEEPAWWACLNTIIAIAMQRRAANHQFRAVSAYSWRFFNNAFSVFNEIVSARPTLLHVQSLLVMAVFLRWTSDTITFDLIVSTAARMAWILGLNTDPDDEFGLQEAEQRRRVFWVLYMFDLDSSIGSQLPLNLSGRFGVKLPSQNPIDGLGKVEDVGGQTLNIHRLAAELCLIKAKAHGLFGVDAGRPHMESLHEVPTLLARLEDWRKEIPEPLRPPWERALVGPVSAPLSMLHMQFYTCVCSLNHSLISGSSLAESSKPGTSPDLQLMALTARLSTDACRASLNLFHHTELSSMLEFWDAFVYLLTMTLTLVAGVLRAPFDPHAASDLELLESVTSTLEDLRKLGCDIGETSWFLNCLKNVAKSAVLRGYRGVDRGASEIGAQLSGQVQEEPHRLIQQLSSVKNYSYLVKGLIGSLPGPCAAARTLFSEILPDHSDEVAPLAPDSLRQDTYGTLKARMCLKIWSHQPRCDVRVRVTIESAEAEYIKVVNPYDTKRCPIECEGDNMIAKWLKCNTHKCCYMTAEIIRCFWAKNKACEEMTMYHSFTQRELTEDRSTFRKMLKWQPLLVLDEHIPASPPWSKTMPSHGYVAHRQDFLAAGAALYDATAAFRKHISMLLTVSSHLRSSEHEACKKRAAEWPRYRRYPTESLPSCCLDDCLPTLWNKLRKLREDLAVAELTLRCQRALLDYAKSNSQDVLCLGMNKVPYPTRLPCVRG